MFNLSAAVRKIRLSAILLAAASISTALTAWSPASAHAEPCPTNPLTVLTGCGGGMTMTPGDSLYTSTNICSAGLTGTIGGVHYIVTAGHCYRPGAQVKDFNGRPIGWYEFGRPDNPDAFGFALIHLYDNVATAAGSPGPNGLTITSVDTKPAVGQQICKEGNTTNKTCGQISDVSATHIYANSLHDDHGDSGGLVCRQTGPQQVAFVGLIFGFFNDNHGAIIEPATRLLDQINRFGPHTGPFIPELND